MAWGRRRTSYCRFCYISGHNIKKCPDVAKLAADPTNPRHEQAKTFLAESKVKHCSYCRWRGGESAGHTVTTCKAKKEDVSKETSIRMEFADIVADVAASHGITNGAIFFASDAAFDLDYYFGQPNNELYQFIELSPEVLFQPEYFSGSIFYAKNMKTRRRVDIKRSALGRKSAEFNEFENTRYRGGESNKNFRDCINIILTVVAKSMITPPIDYEVAYTKNIETLATGIRNRLVKPRKKRTS